MTAIKLDPKDKLIGFTVDETLKVETGKGKPLEFQANAHSLHARGGKGQAEAKRDPLARMARYLVAERLATEKELKELEAAVDLEIREAADKALAAQPPKPEKVMFYLYSPTADPTSDQFDHPPKFHGEPRTMVDQIYACLRDEMTRDPRVVVFGEDVADCSHEDELHKVQGKGGVFKVTHGLQGHFGSARCYNVPLAEASIVGRALGMAAASTRHR